VTLRHCCVLLPRERNKRDEHNVTRDGELRVTIKAETDRPGTYRMRGEDVEPLDLRDFHRGDRDDPLQELHAQRQISLRHLSPGWMPSMSWKTRDLLTRSSFTIGVTSDASAWL